jgi:hypothetical protein
MKFREDYFRDLCTNGGIILKWILRQIGCEGVDSTSSTEGTMADSGEQGNEPTGSEGNFLTI